MLLFSFIAIGLLMADSRLGALGTMRQAVGVALYPLQAIAMMPRDGFFAVTNYFSSLNTLHAENRRMRDQQIRNAQQLQEGAQLRAENSHLRKLLAASEQTQSRTVMSEILSNWRIFLVLLIKRSRHINTNEIISIQMTGRVKRPSCS
jgi:rod shape-determining protein MreC